MEPQQQRVKQFMEFFGQACPEKPTQLDQKTAELRANLILEEVFETITKGLGLDVEIQDDAHNRTYIAEEGLKKLKFSYHKRKEVDLVELADGISDISVVSYGTALAAGIDMEPIDKIVAESNASKAWAYEDIEMAKKLYPDAKIEKYSDNLYRLIRKDGKVIKSPNFSNPTPKMRDEMARQTKA